MNETMDLSKELVTFSFVTPAENQPTSSKVDFKKKMVVGSFQENDHFQRGLLLETVEKGVTYPIVHRGSIQNYFQKETEDRANKFVVAKGCYQEVEKVQVDLFGSALDDLSSRSSGAEEGLWSSFFVVLGFKQLPISGRAEVLEQHWKEWTGARYLFLHLPHQFGPVRITFYKRFTPDHFSLFLYLVVAECLRVIPSDVASLQDFVQRMRADKMPFYLALYKDLGLVQQDDQVKGRRSRWTSGGSTEVSSVSEEASVSPRMTSTPIFGSPVPAYHSTLTFLNF